MPCGKKKLFKGQEMNPKFWKIKLPSLKLTWFIHMKQPDKNTLEKIAQK